LWWISYSGERESRVRLRSMEPYAWIAADIVRFEDDKLAMP
jgi:hypothetical protein